MYNKLKIWYSLILLSMISSAFSQIKIDGPGDWEICPGQEVSYFVMINPIPNCDFETVNWSIEPANAGLMQDIGNNKIKVHWNLNYQGNQEATLKANVIQFCGFQNDPPFYNFDYQQQVSLLPVPNGDFPQLAGLSEIKYGQSSIYEVFELIENIQGYNWYLGDELIANTLIPQYELNTDGLALGMHILKCLPYNVCGQENDKLLGLYKPINILPPCDEGAALISTYNGGPLCKDDQHTISINGYSGDVNYEWLVPEGVEVLSNELPNLEVKFLQKGVFDIQAIPEYELCEALALQFDVNDIPLNITQIQTQELGCQYNTYVYEAEGAEGATHFNWLLPEGVVINPVDPTYRKVELTYNELGIQNIEVVPSNECGEALESYSFSIEIDHNYDKTTTAEYTYGELEGFVAKHLYINTCEERTSPCYAYKTLQGVDLYAKIDLGANYNWGENPFEVQVGLKITAYSEEPVQPKVFSTSLSIHQDQPEQLYHITLDEDLADLRVFTIEVVDFQSQNNQIQDVLNLRVYYQEDVLVDVSEYDVQLLSVNNEENSWVAEFEWTSLCENMPPNYQFQLYKLFGATAPEDLTEQDWKNALDIETSSRSQNLKLTVAEGDGSYAWRVRALGNLEGGISNVFNWGPWSTPGQFTFAQPDADKNIIYSRTFVEDGRVGEQMTFANGLQQVKQKQNLVQSDEEVVVQQTVHDYVGRAALESLPVPIQEQTELGYVEKAIKNPLDLPYQAADFDDDPQAPTPAMDKSNYYSGQEMGNNTNVAAAEGFPYSRTIFSNDCTQRVKEQAGVGMKHSVVGGRTVQNFYIGVSEAELVRVFGKEAPNANSVHKTITIDANKTASVTYTSKEGKTLATALIVGAQNNALEPLPSQFDPENTVHEIIEEKVPFGPYGSTSLKPLFFLMPTNVHIEYSIEPEIIEDICSQICNTCDYKITFILHDQENPENSQELLVHTIPAGDCANLQDAMWNTAFDVPIESGNYVLEKRVESYTKNGADEFYIDNQLAKVEEDYAQEIENDFLIINDLIEQGSMVDLYDHLASLNYEFVEENNSSYYKVPVACDQYIHVPYLLDECELDDCNTETLDFEAYFTSLYEGKDFVDTDEDGYWLFMKDYKPGEFNQTIVKMITDPEEDFQYDCNHLWAAWKVVANSYETMIQDFGDQQNPDLDWEADMDGYEYDIVEEFLKALAAKLAQVNEDIDDENLKVIRFNNTYADLPIDHKFTVYKEFLFYPEDNNMNECLSLALEEQQVASFDQLDYAARYQVWTCVNSINPNLVLGPMTQEDALEEAAQKQEECGFFCNARKEDFKQGVIDFIHGQWLYIEGDQYELVFDDVLNKVIPAGPELDNPENFTISLCEVDKIVDSLVVNCQQNYCKLTPVSMEIDGETVWVIGTDEELENIQKILTHQFALQLNQGDPEMGQCLIEGVPEEETTKIILEE